jgi:hypothetical protein
MKKMILIIAFLASFSAFGYGQEIIIEASVTTSASEVAPYSKYRNWIIIQNVSDTDIYLKFNGATTALTTSNGIKLAAGAILTLTNNSTTESNGMSNLAKYSVVAIHGGSGSKTLRIQGGK